MQEIVLLTAVTGCLLVLVVQLLGQYLHTSQKLLADLENYRAARMVFSTLERELTLEADTITLEQNDWGPILVVQENGPRKSMRYYRRPLSSSSQLGLYQSTITEGKGEGINPLTTEAVEVTSWQVRRLTEKQLELELEVCERKLGRSYVQTRVVSLANGAIL